MTTFETAYQAMLAADAAGEHATSAVRAAASEARLLPVRIAAPSDAAMRNRANLGSLSAAQRNAALVGRPRGPMGQAS